MFRPAPRFVMLPLDPKPVGSGGGLMLFSSITFLFYFLPLFLLAYHLLPAPNLVLLLASLLFYAWGDPTRLPLLLFCILLNYGFGLAVGRSGRHRRLWLGLGVAGNLALLLFYKYAGFLVAQWAALAPLVGLAAPEIPQVALPLGISFFTFQGISYLIDIHRGIVVPQRSLLRFAMYKAMFPPLVAGPIVRYAVIADRVDRRPVTPALWARGIESFTIGLGQKVLLANTLAGPVDRLFALPPADLSPAAAWLAAAGYALQIYFDFAGYSNMAIGLGRMIGFELPANFNRPYAARSVTDFWRRWHITLSTWFRDYLYIPLGGNRGGPWRTGANLTLVFLLCGLWHGASWNFALWGLYHGAFLVAERIGLARVLVRLPPLLRHAYLILVVVVGWVPFRAEDFGRTAAMLRAMAGGTSGAMPDLAASCATALIVGSIVAVWPRDGRPLRLPAWAGHAACLLLLVLSAANLAAGTYNPFIYFRF
ncbi:MAG: rane-bound O-acyltransferase family protein [Rhodospirillales bacterium]|nr:rane-bound O-acyltransferase family protein [Rhodospirillales bacterium]